MYQRLIYVSRALPSVSARDVYDIIRVAHNRNSQFGLGGGLLFLDGYFVQVLEGDDFRLRERFGVISADPRHTGLQLRQRSQVSERLFDNDWMALRLQHEIRPQRLQALGYQPGLPDAQFSADALVDFVKACCDDALATA
jgi:hypothetical protein